MTFNISGASRTGCVRKNNEDMILVGEWFVRNGKMSTHVSTSDTDRYLMAVADGMGGHNSGEVASCDVLHNLQFFFSDLPVGLSVSDFNESMYEWLTSINNIIDSKGHSEERYSKMGTTLVGLCYFAGEYYWMNCGDSRIYRFRSGKLTQLSTDHSLSSLLGETERSSIITNCIGGGCRNSFIDIVNITADIRPGDQFLICSDGLTDMVSNIDLAIRLGQRCTADDLCDDAEKAGGNDNVSAIVVQLS